MAVATATAEGLRRVAEAIKVDGGHEAMQLRVAEQYVAQFGELAKKTTTLVLPANAADVGSMIALATQVIQHAEAGVSLRSSAAGDAACYDADSIFTRKTSSLVSADFLRKSAAPSSCPIN